jgi:BirA family biotin operon repressor/biotin-[acetyl-CoA-carboxylase] ligase
MDVSADEVFFHLSRTMFVRLKQWAKGAGFAAVRSDWLIRASGVGQSIRVRRHRDELSGEFQGLDETGQLLLRLPDGQIQAVNSGEIFMLGASRMQPAG